MINTQETETGTIPAEWDYEPLESFFDLITYGFTAPMPTVDEGPYMITAKDVNEGRIKYENARKTSKEAFDKILTNKSRPKVNDILITKDASIGRVAIVEKENLCINQSVALIRPNKRIRPLFLKYLLESPLYQKLIFRDASGSTILHIYITRINKMLIGVPSLDEQDGILGVIHTIQKKIDLLKAQNKTLETMAQTIFKEWFGKYQIGDELPEGWRVGVIGDLIEIKRGGSPRPIKDYISDSGYRWLKISDASATSSPYIFIIKEHIKKEGLKKTTLKHKGDLVLSNSATPGIPKFLAVDTCVHDGWMHFPSSKVSNEYLYLLFLSIRPKLVQQGSGSVFVNLKTDTLRQFETIIASKNDFKAFDNIIKPIFTKIYNNALQIQSLTKTRDTLLPKLMSGQVRVNNIKQTVDA
jgi:type I restriction enzyme S subunit